MAEHRAAIRPFGLLHGALARIAALPTRNIRLTVLLCVVAIGGSFAAAGALQMRFDAAKSYHQAAYFEARRARDIAAVAEASLARHERIGHAFATGKIDELPDGVLGITVADLRGAAIAAQGRSMPVENLADLTASGRAVLGTRERTLIAFRDNNRIVALMFGALVPPALLDNAELVGTSDALIAGTPAAGEMATARAGGWPVEARVALDDPDAVAAWYGSLPLYLFVIFGPALVGAWLATVFVREFERRAKASEAIRSLRSTRPAEARLLVRLATAEREAAEAARSKAEFIAHMSHELRTPLNAIIGFAEIIERGLYGLVGHPKYTEYARDIGRAGRHLHNRIGDVLEFANLEAGRFALKPVAFNVSALVQACVDESAGRAFSRRIRLDMIPAPPAMVFADPMAVRRIVSNLIANALANTQDRGRVRLEVREDDGAVAITVADTGRPPPRTGMRPFRRHPSPGLSTFSGLGLAIVVALARRMGGALKLSGEPGEGTAAELRLPKG